jgi:hypothetical protein
MDHLVSFHVSARVTWATELETSNPTAVRAFAEEDAIRCSPKVAPSVRETEMVSELEPGRRLELLTCALRVRCSTV